VDVLIHLPPTHAFLRKSKIIAMRVGRLQASTLSNIWKSLEPNLESTTLHHDSSKHPALPEKLQKQYIPMNSDSPLYRLISVMANSSLSLNGEIQQQEGIIANHLAFFNRNPNRGMSVPSLPIAHLDNHLPAPRMVQSTGDLFPDITPSQTNYAGETMTRQNAVSRHIPSAIANQMLSESDVGSSESLSVNDHHVPFVRTTSFPVSSSSLAQATSVFPNSNKIEKERKHWSEDYMHMDIDWSMQAMDVLYSASFYDYIRDERNCDLSAQRLCRIIKDYKPRQVANALLWMIQGWSVENTSKLLRTIFSDWLPDLAGYK
jgi:hypothetical protein